MRFLAVEGGFGGSCGFRCAGAGAGGCRGIGEVGAGLRAEVDAEREAEEGVRCLVVNRVVDDVTAGATRGAGDGYDRCPTSGRRVTGPIAVSKTIGVVLSAAAASE
jgi:hypothetical protein